VQPPLPFLAGYPEALRVQVRELIEAGQLGAHLARRYPEAHDIRTDGALYEHASALKARFLRNAPALAKVAYEGRLQIDQRALGTLTAVSRVQGGRLTAKREDAESLQHLPFIAALLFAVHPVHTEIVANIKGRDEILVSLLGSAVRWRTYWAAAKGGCHEASQSAFTHRC